MSIPEDPFLSVAGFEWDDDNREKNWIKHEVRSSEIEEVFGQRPIRIIPDERHSTAESRYAAWGRTSSGRLLAVVFTFRGSLIRAVSARDMSRRERREFEDATKAEADPGVR